MKKITILSGAIALAVGGYYYLQRPPKFEGKYAPLHEFIWKFSKTNDTKEKLSIALRIQLSATLGGLHPESAPDLSEAEKKISDEASHLVEVTVQEAQDFEAHLTLSDIALITQDNPDSFFKSAGFFSTTHRDKKCTKDQYSKIRETVGLRELLEKGTYVGPLITVYDSRFHDGYIQKIIELLKKEDRFSNYRNLADTYYAINLGLASSSDESRKRTYEDKLIAAGVEPAKLKDYAFKLASQSPDCLGKISIDFFKFMKEDITKTRGKFLLGKLREYIQTHGKVPEDIEDLSVDKSDPVLGSTSDGWNNRFALAKENHLIKLFSLGEDWKENTADDIQIGAVPF